MLFCPNPFFSSSIEDVGTAASKKNRDGDSFSPQEYLSVKKNDPYSEDYDPGDEETEENPSTLSPPSKTNSTEAKEAPPTAQTEVATPETVTPAVSADDTEPSAGTVDRPDEATGFVPRALSFEESSAPTEEVAPTAEAEEVAPTETESKTENVTVVVEPSASSAPTVEDDDDDDDDEKDTYHQAMVSPFQFILLAIVAAMVAKLVVGQYDASLLRPLLQETVVSGIGDTVVVEQVEPVQKEIFEQASITEEVDEDPVMGNIEEEIVAEANEDASDAGFITEEVDEDPVMGNIEEEIVAEANEDASDEPAADVDEIAVEEVQEEMFEEMDPVMDNIEEEEIVTDDAEEMAEASIEENEEL
eukprot:CAMPEP_0197196546 /NCGR_PEP_ID=MMETSP1423-20130617/32414_1 /TAXON_ID=476441 /ORGANISM="Pseudo-nitzschia heimii, Strain UNC1101" /LENGTH=359 /DNA_ID=CAMNT_0042650353 /DNA_START=36 /DNA_END=1116 /DNA_ORIENTATION=-